MSMCRQVSRLIFSMVVVLAAAACTKRGSNVEVELVGKGKVTLKQNETLRINLSSEPPSLDWHKATDTTSSMILDNIMEGLVTYNLNDKELGLLPGLATKWEPSSDARIWKLTLRTGVKWTDGVEFTAQHVIDGWKRLLDPMTASEYAYFLHDLKNAKNFNEGKTKDFNEVGAKITGPNEITVELEKPMSYFPYLLTHASTFPVRLDVVQKHGDKWTEAANTVTLGPYKLGSWQHDKQIVLERNDGYYGEKAHIPYIVAYMVLEQATSLNLFESGKLDVMLRLPSTELRKLKTRKEYRETGILGAYFYGMNTTKVPTNNPLVRKALSQAIDRQQIVQILAGGQIPMTSFIPAGMFGYEADRGLTFNVEKAKESLKKAGYEDPSKFPKLELKFNTNEDHQKVAENIQAQLKKNLGIEVELKNEEWKVFLNTQKTDPPHLYRSGWFADYPDPDNFMTLMTSASENNRTRWKSTKFDEIVKKAASVTNKEERRKLYSDAQKMLVEDEVPVIPLYSGVAHLLVNERLENFPVNALDKFLFKNVRLKQ